MADYLGNVWFYASAAAGVLVVAYFVFSSLASKDDYSHKRSDQEQNQENLMADDVTPPRKGDYSVQQLLEHDGRDASKAVLLSLFSESLHSICRTSAISSPRRNRVRRHFRPLLLWARWPLRNICRTRLHYRSRLAPLIASFYCFFLFSLVRLAYDASQAKCKSKRRCSTLTAPPCLHRRLTCEMMPLSLKSATRCGNSCLAVPTIGNESSNQNILCWVSRDLQLLSILTRYNLTIPASVR